MGLYRDSIGIMEYNVEITMINKPPPLKGLNIEIPIIITIEGGGLLIMGLHYTCNKETPHGLLHAYEQKFILLVSYPSYITPYITPPPGSCTIAHAYMGASKNECYLLAC